VEHRGIFDTDHCGAGPSSTAQLRMWVNYEADGPDTQNLAGEYVRIQNTGSSDVSIAGWKLRDAGHHLTQRVVRPGHTYFTFPSGSVVRAGSFITVFAVDGTQDPAHGRFFLDISTLPAFPNVTDPTLGYPGMALFLLDPDLDFRAWADYPCLIHCVRPPVHIHWVKGQGTPEVVSLRVDDGVTSAVDLSGVVVTNDGWVREIDPGTYLLPGETLRLLVQGDGVDTRLKQYWHKDYWIFEDSGDTIVLRTATGLVLDTFSYGSG
jgi:lamin tail-like protein